MATKRTIAIIGALEEKGREVIQILAQTNYRLLLFYKETEQPELAGEPLEQQHPQLEKEWISCLVEASWEADIIVIAAPVEEQAKVAADIKAVVTGKPVILVNETYAGNALEESLPYSPVFSVAASKITELIQNI